MSDRLNSLFQQRFQGHEAPVGADLWEGIQQQLASTSPATDGVHDLFQERFQGHEVSVDPSAWVAISSQLGHTATAGTAVGSIWGWVAAGAVAVVVTTAAYFMVASSDPAPVAEVQKAAPNGDLQPVELITLHEVPKADNASAPTTSRTVPVPEKRRSDTPTASPTVVARTAGAMLAESTTVVVPEPRETHEQQEGSALVSDIISGLEEQVWHQPVTARPEPGITAAPALENKAERPASIEPTIDSPINAPAPLPKLFMPNTFTPNGDGVNDTYTVDGDGYASIMLRVYSMKTNSLVFTTNSGQPWTGEGCEDGMYMVAMEAHTPDGRSTTEGKVVWLTRNRMN